MPSKTKPLSSKELAKFEAGRDLGAELLQSIREMKAGKVRVAYSPATEAREKTGLSQSQFAALLGVSVRTLQGWEQGRTRVSLPYHRRLVPLLVPHLHTAEGRAWLATLGAERAGDG